MLSGTIAKQIIEEEFIQSFNDCYYKIENRKNNKREKDLVVTIYQKIKGKNPLAITQSTISYQDPRLKGYRDETPAKSRVMLDMAWIEILANLTTKFPELLGPVFSKYYLSLKLLGSDEKQFLKNFKIQKQYLWDMSLSDYYKKSDQSEKDKVDGLINFFDSFSDFLIEDLGMSEEDVSIYTDE